MKKRKWVISLLTPLVFLTACGSLKPVESMDSPDNSAQEQSDAFHTSDNTSSRYSTTIDSSGGKILANIDAEVQADMTISYPVLTTTVQPFTPEYIQKMVEEFYYKDSFSNIHVDYSTMSLAELEEKKETLLANRDQLQEFCTSGPIEIDSSLKANALDLLAAEIQSLDNYIQTYVETDVESPCFDLLSRNVMSEDGVYTYLDEALHRNDTIGTASFTGKRAGETYNMHFERMGEFNNALIVERDMSNTPILSDYPMECCDLIDYQGSIKEQYEDYISLHSEEKELPDLEQSKEACEQMLHALGIDGMTYSYDSPMYVAAYPNEAVKDLGFIAADSFSSCGRILTYHRDAKQAPYRQVRTIYDDNIATIPGINVFYNKSYLDKDSQGYMGYRINMNNCSPEKIEFYLTDLGVIKMIYYTPSVVTKTEENVTMLPLEDIINNASDALERLSKTQSTMAISGKNYYDISNITLGMCEIRNPEFPDTKQIIPVWDFCNSDGLVIISFNAIDGTAIDRISGY